MSELKWYFRHNYHWPKTRQEAKASTDPDYKKLVRAKRNAANLCNDRDGYYIKRPRCWKDRRKTQYRSEPRGKRHEMVFDVGVYEWDFKEYCESHNIPYEVEEIRERYTYSLELHKEVYRRRQRRVYDYAKREWVYKNAWGSDWVPSGVWKEYIGRRVIGYRFIWWSDKDIGIDYILNRSSMRLR